MALQQHAAPSPAKIKAEIRALDRLEVRFADHVEGATRALRWALGEGPAESKTLGDTIAALMRMHGDIPAKRR